MKDDFAIAPIYPGLESCALCDSADFVRRYGPPASPVDGSHSGHFVACSACGRAIWDNDLVSGHHESLDAAVLDWEERQRLLIRSASVGA